MNNKNNKTIIQYIKSMTKIKLYKKIKHANRNKQFF